MQLLDERYKTSYRVQNARKRKKKKENKTVSLAPTSVRSGHGTQQLVCEPYSSDDGDDNKAQDSKPVNINEKQKVDSSNGSKTDTNSSPPVIRDVTECEHSQLKDFIPHFCTTMVPFILSSTFYATSCVKTNMELHDAYCWQRSSFMDSAILGDP
jgi:hypothetical protein